MQERFTRQAQAALALAKKCAKSWKHSYIGTEHLLAGLLLEEEGTAGAVLREAHVEMGQLKELIDKLVAPVQEQNKELGYTPRAEVILEEAREEAEQFRADETGTEHILMALLKDTDCVATRLLHTMGQIISTLFASLVKAMGEEERYSQDDLSSGRAMKAGTGNTLSTLEQYSRDLTALAERGELDPIVGREDEISRLIQILSRRTKNNPCLVGEPGVGKTAVVEGLAQRIVAEAVPENMKNKRIMVLDLSSMVAGTKYRGEFEERIKNVVAEVSQHRDILLFLDELHTIIGAGGAEGALDASNILKPSLSRGEIQLIGATTLEEYRKYIEKDAALERRFQPITVEEPTEEETIEILRGLRPYYEKHHRVEITEEAIAAAVRMSKRYLNDRFLPDKALDVIDEASSKVQLRVYEFPKEIDELEKQIKEITEKVEALLKSGELEEARNLHQEQNFLKEDLERQKKKAERAAKRKNKVVDEEAIAEIIAQWTKIPVKRLAQQESKRLANLETTLHKRVIGQEMAVKAVAQAVKRGRVGLKDPNRPIGSFLFLGPTGVGKTELSKALAEAVFGSEDAMIRVDMSEYMEKHSVSKMIGSPPGYVGYDEAGQLSEKVRRNPYSVILFDEIEKAHPDVFNILLQVLDDGHITDAHGRKVDFKQTIIIMTSNAGAQTIMEPKKLGFGAVDDESKNYERMKSGVMEEIKRVFRPEFLNRIDDISVFHALNKKDIRAIVDLLLKDLEKRCMDQMQITLRVTPAVKNDLAEKAYDSKYGARPLRRAIQTRIEDELANEILSGNVAAGDIVQVKLIKNKIEIRTCV